MVKSIESRTSVSRGPFFRPIRVHDVPEKLGLDRRIEATPQECAAIAAEQGLPAVASLTAAFHIARRAGGRFDVTGKLEAAVTQICVVSLEPFEAVLRQDIAIGFVLPGRDMPMRGQPVAVIDIETDEDPPDPIVDNTIDLGAVALEFLTLARDFYPKKPGVHFTDVLIGEKDQPEPSSFAALGRLKDKS